MIESSSFVKAVFNRFAANYKPLYLGGVLAVLLANLVPGVYHDIQHWHTELGVVNIDLHFIVNDIMMGVFFFMVVTEVWKELLPGGRLHGFKTAAMPFIQALGGVIAPGVLFAFVFGVDPDLRIAWPSSAATDIVLALVIITRIAGRFHPIIPVLLAIAIVDDMYGIALIAILYPEGSLESKLWLMLSVGVIAFMVIMNRRLGIRNPWAYIALMPVSGLGFYLAGVHPTLGVALTAPAIPFVLSTLHSESEVYHQKRARGEVSRSTLLEIEHMFQLPYAYILMFFAFFNVGINLIPPYEGVEATSAVLFSLIIGKPVGILLATVLCLMLGMRLPSGVNLPAVAVASCVAAIGMTVSIFVLDIALTSDVLLEGGKLGAFLSLPVGAALAYLVARSFRLQRVDEPLASTHVHIQENLRADEDMIPHPAEGSATA